MSEWRQNFGCHKELLLSDFRVWSDPGGKMEGGRRIPFDRCISRESVLHIITPINASGSPIYHLVCLLSYSHYSEHLDGLRLIYNYDSHQ